MSSRLEARNGESTDPSALFDVPSGLSKFYSALGVKGSLECTGGVAIDDRAQGYQTNGQGKDGTHYCAPAKDDKPQYVWWMSNMDVDCDGAPSTEGICEGDGSYFELTAYTDSELWRLLSFCRGAESHDPDLPCQARANLSTL